MRAGMPKCCGTLALTRPSATLSRRERDTRPYMPANLKPRLHSSHPCSPCFTLLGPMRACLRAGARRPQSHKIR